ncbi:hypothetical protein DQE82_26875 [Micromonospora sp. LHW51205]|uniref:hypothetical protein n=1 Tax=Micromonospora sp. LHW51205 TaxID=2248752 RepID=UPI000DEABFB2|nr:hypothetical protein [Micromonospora sp. LHW51205]RBQ05173.1 hypothetical protein DQE82_26875 [Micromonospora sp. LHW51205]
MTDLENATVREWTDLLARIRFGTVKVAGKTITGRVIKAVGYRAANYADADGSRVRPGLPRLAVDLEIDHGTAKRAVQVIVRAGLLRLVRAGARPGLADEYQLTIPNDLLDRTGLEVWSPAKHRLEVERVREQTRGRYRKRPEPSADADTCRSQEDPQKSDLQVPEGPADTPAADRPAGPAGTDITRPAGPVRTDLQVPEGPATHHGPRHNTTHPTDEEVRTALTGPRATEPEEPEFVDEVTPDPQPSGCPTHGRAFAAGNRPDGRPRCPLCRRAPATGLAPVIPLSRRSAG